MSVITRRKALTLNGDPSEHVDYYEGGDHWEDGDFIDMKSVRVEVEGESVYVTFDVDDVWRINEENDAKYADIDDDLPEHRDNMYGTDTALKLLLLDAERLAAYHEEWYPMYHQAEIPVEVAGRQLTVLVVFEED